MKQLKSLLTVLLLSVFYLGSAQQYVDVATERSLMSKGLSPKIDAVGSPYINENFTAVKIKGYDDKIYSGRYNAYNGEMEIKLYEGKIIALDVYSSDYEVVFIGENKTYNTVAYNSESGILKKGFLVSVYSNEKVQLLKEEKIKFIEKIEATSSYQKDKPAKFRRQGDDYYIKLGTNDAQYLPSKKKDLAKAFPSKSKEISSFIKKNKLKLNKEEDLIKVAEYLGTIL